MNLIPASVYSFRLSAAEFKLATAFYELADQFGRIRISKKELGNMTNISLATLTRSFRKLEALGLLATSRRRKGRNYFDENAYQLLMNAEGEKFPSAPIVAPLIWAKEPLLESELAVSPSLIREQSTPDYVAEVVVSSSSQIDREETDLLRKSLSPEQSPVDKSESEIESESSPRPSGKARTTAAPLKAPKLATAPRVNNPRDARTRDLRPERDWSVYDVSAEFCYRINQINPTLPPLLNARRLSGALSKMRKELGIGPAEELWLMHKFIPGKYDYGRTTLVKQPELILGKFLNMFKSHLSDARQDGMRKLEEREEQRDRLLHPEKYEEQDRERAEQYYRIWVKPREEARARADLERQKAEQQQAARAEEEKLEEARRNKRREQMELERIARLERESSEEEERVKVALESSRTTPSKSLDELAEIMSQLMKQFETQ